MFLILFFSVSFKETGNTLNYFNLIISTIITLVSAIPAGIIEIPRQYKCFFQ